MTHANLPFFQRGTAYLASCLLVAAGTSVPWFDLIAKESNPEVPTAVVTRGDIEDLVSSLGSLQPRDFVDVGAQVSGQLKKIAVRLGETVERGALVAEMDPVVFAAKVEAGRASLRSIAAQLDEKAAQRELAQQQYERNARMFKQDAISRDALQTTAAASRVAGAQIETLRAQQDQMRATLKVDEASLNYTRIHAPISGTVVALMARQGQTLNANQQAPLIMRIADLSTMTVVAQVSEADVARLRTDMPAYFNTLGRPDRRWRGVVRQVLPTPETINNVVLYNVLFDVDNADGELRTQMSAQVFFVLGQARDALLLPASALKAVKSLPRAAENQALKQPLPDAADLDGEPISGPSERRRVNLRVARVDGQLEERIVELGIVTRTHVQVLAGLREGERVVLAGAIEAKSPSGKKSGKRLARL